MWVNTLTFKATHLLVKAHRLHLRTVAVWKKKPLVLLCVYGGDVVCIRFLLLLSEKRLRSKASREANSAKT